MIPEQIHFNVIEGHAPTVINVYSKSFAQICRDGIVCKTLNCQRATFKAISLLEAMGYTINRGHGRPGL